MTDNQRRLLTMITTLHTCADHLAKLIAEPENLTFKYQAKLELECARQHMERLES